MFMTPIELKKKLIKEFKEDDKIIVLINNPMPPYDEGYCVDTVKGFLANYEDLTESPGKTFCVTVGKQIF
ncbi:hypothetical protein KAR91_51685 [Candidatus Pacearchaeota archaeon]|nr:hypothetical protein [Candidatus Pacearchaeota archaeon]